MPLALFYAPWRPQKAKGFLIFAVGVENESHEIG